MIGSTGGRGGRGGTGGRRGSEEHDVGRVRGWEERLASEVLEVDWVSEATSLDLVVRRARFEVVAMEVEEGGRKSGFPELGGGCRRRMLASAFSEGTVAAGGICSSTTAPPRS